jgi:hypothetical protein
VTEKAVVDKDFDSLMSVGLNGMSMQGEGGGAGFHFANSFSGASQSVDSTNGFATGHGGFGAWSFGGGGANVPGATSSSAVFYSSNGSTNATQPER